MAYSAPTGSRRKPPEAAGLQHRTQYSAPRLRGKNNSQVGPGRLVGGPVDWQHSPYAGTPLAFNLAFFSGEIIVSSLNSLRAFSPRMFRFACWERNGRS